MEKKKKNAQAAEAVEEETAQQEATEVAEEPAAADAAQLEELTKQLNAKAEECAALNDKYLRMAAEYENFRKRSAKEREGVYADACADCIAALLPVLDNLERAAQYKSDDPATVAKGLEMTLKSFYDTLGKLGVNEIPAETFDPNLHNAVMHIEDDEHGESEIVEVLQKGFAKGDKVIRYAMVKVAN
ncbi:MAG: nucleotide exchange factor GrpE [Clostridia bacterium]|jgi:molecular chaperone GrpE|nr:nucleotide exchange factor GrpE [Clostridia bacterium]